MTHETRHMPPLPESPSAGTPIWKTHTTGLPTYPYPYPAMTPALERLEAQVAVLTERLAALEQRIRDDDEAAHVKEMLT